LKLTKETPMATIDVRRTHALPLADARKLAEDLLRSMKHSADFDLRWDGDRMVFRAPRGIAKGTQGSVDLTEKDVRVRIDLPLLLSVAKGTVEAKLNEKLNRFSAS
jgi:putative polyhydroxyalkanoate system protein